MVHVMELKAKFVPTLFLLILLATPCFSRGRIYHHMRDMDPEVYVIDYRGPETHRHVPPPNRAGERPSIHHQFSMVRHRSKNSKAQRNGRKIHG